MAIKDIESKLQPRVALAATIATDTNTDGSIIDTANFELGLLFTLDVVSFNDGAYELQLFESNDSGMAGATQIVAPAILPTDLGANSISASAAVVAGDIVQKIGAYSNLRYVRPRIVSTGTTSGAEVRVTVIQAGEESPVATS